MVGHKDAFATLRAHLSALSPAAAAERSRGCVRLGHGKRQELCAWLERAGSCKETRRAARSHGFRPNSNASNIDTIGSADTTTRYWPNESVRRMSTLWTLRAPAIGKYEFLNYETVLQETANH
eukprot:scaffold433_cov257-Pinguiococcus_pyrenoidosus.AAC.13